MDLPPFLPRPVPSKLAPGPLGTIAACLIAGRNDTDFIAVRTTFVGGGPPRPVWACDEGPGSAEYIIGGCSPYYIPFQ